MASWVELDTNAHSTAAITHVKNGRSGGFSVNYAPDGGGGTPNWVYIAAVVAVVFLFTRRKT